MAERESARSGESAPHGPKEGREIFVGGGKSTAVTHAFSQVREKEKTERETEREAGGDETHRGRAGSTREDTRAQSSVSQDIAVPTQLKESLLSCQ